MMKKTKQKGGKMRMKFIQERRLFLAAITALQLVLLFSCHSGAQEPRILNLGSFQPIQPIQAEVVFPGTIFHQRDSLVVKQKEMMGSDHRTFPANRIQLLVGKETYPLTFSPEDRRLPVMKGEELQIRMQILLRPSDPPGQYKGAVVLGEQSIIFALEIDAWVQLMVEFPEHPIHLSDWRSKQVQSEFPLQMKVASNSPWILEGMIEEETIIDGALKLSFLQNQNDDYQVHFPQGTTLQDTPRLLLSGNPTTVDDDYWTVIYLGFTICDFTKFPAGILSSSLSFQVSPVE